MHNKIIRFNNSKKQSWQPKKCIVCGVVFERTLNDLNGHWKKRTCCSVECKGVYCNSKMSEGLIKKYLPKECPTCKEKFQPKNSNHYYCGSKKYKIGCSWQHEILRRKKSSREHKMYGSRKFWLNTNKSFVR